MGLRKWIKILPFFIVENICMKFNCNYQKIGQKTFLMYDMFNGIFLLKDVDISLRERKKKLENELEEINDKLNKD